MISSLRVYYDITSLDPFNYQMVRLDTLTTFIGILKDSLSAGCPKRRLTDDLLIGYYFTDYIIS